MSTEQATDAKDKLRSDALHYHRYPPIYMARYIFQEIGQ